MFCDCVSLTLNRLSVSPRLTCVHKKAQKKNRTTSVKVMYALSRRVRLESSRPQLPQSLHAPSITVEALEMSSKYPGMGSTSTDPASPVWLLIVVQRRVDQRVETRKKKYSNWRTAGNAEEQDSPDSVTNPSTSLLAHLKPLKQAYVASLTSSVA